MNINICLVGGGNLTHAIAGFLGAKNNVKINILTRKPELWSKEILVTSDSTKLVSHINLITNDTNRAVTDTDIVLLCLPGFAIKETLEKIKPFIGSSTKVGSVVSSTGFFFEALDILPKDISLFGFQRVPFIARTIEYGKSAKILGDKKELKIAIERDNNKEDLRSTIEYLFEKPTILLENHFAVSLSNSNPLLHTSRLYTMFNNDKVLYDKNPLFYADWTDEASEVLIQMDKEFFLILDKCNVKQGIVPILEYYESYDKHSLTNKLRSIKAFKSILSPMIETQGKYKIDWNSRYFTEDFPFGLKYIYDLAHKYDIPVPTIDKVYLWGVKMIAKNKNKA